MYYTNYGFNDMPKEFMDKFNEGVQAVEGPRKGMRTVKTDDPNYAAYLKQNKDQDDLLEQKDLFKELFDKTAGKKTDYVPEFWPKYKQSGLKKLPPVGNVYRDELLAKDKNHYIVEIKDRAILTFCFIKESKNKDMKYLERNNKGIDAEILYVNVIGTTGNNKGDGEILLKFVEEVAKGSACFSVALHAVLTRQRNDETKTLRSYYEKNGYTFVPSKTELSLFDTYFEDLDSTNYEQKLGLKGFLREFPGYYMEKVVWKP